MRTLRLLVLFFAAVAWTWNYWQGRSGTDVRLGKAPDLAYTDTRGGFHNSLAAAGKPALVVLWVTPCPYCTRAMNVLDRLRKRYPEEDLDIVGFYLNPADSASVESTARGEGHSIMVAQGQPTGPFVQALTNGMGFRGPGRDIYVIGKDGKYEAVDSSDLAVADYVITEKLRAILRDRHGLKERDG